MLFQQMHSFYKDEFTLLYGQNLQFPFHIHRSFELYVQIKGKSKIIIDAKEYLLSAGEAVLIFPYQYHSYSYLEPSEYGLCIFSPSLVPDFNKTGYVPDDNKLIYSLPKKISLSNMLLKQALAYTICGEFETGRKYVKRKNTFFNEGLIEILLYINKNFKQNCLLRDAVSAVGYEYTYISKMFKKSIGMTFNQYINLLRIQESQAMLKSTGKNITQIAHDCGFNSLRSFNRKFAEITGMTPSDYRSSSK